MFLDDIRKLWKNGNQQVAANDLPQQGGITGQMPYDPAQIDLPPITHVPYRTPTDQPVALPNDLPPINSQVAQREAQAIPEMPNDALPSQESVPQPAPLPPITSQTYADKINAINNKDYSIRDEPIYNANGEEVGSKQVRGKDRNEKWSKLEKLAGGGLGFLNGLSRGGLFGGLAGLVQGATDRNYVAKDKDRRDLPRITGQYNQAVKQENEVQNQEYNKARTSNIYADNEYNKQRLDEYKQDRLRKTDDRTSRENTARMTQVAGILKNLPAYDPADPKFADLTKALGDVNLPITPKDAKKNVKLVQDQRTGAWTTVLTDPVTSKQEVRDVLGKDGQQFKSTPTVVMQGELGLGRQNDAQDYDRDKQLRQQAFEMKKQKADQDFKVKQTELENAERDKRDAKTEQQRIDAEGRRQKAQSERDAIQNQFQKDIIDYRKENQ